MFTDMVSEIQEVRGQINRIDPEHGHGTAHFVVPSFISKIVVDAEIGIFMDFKELLKKGLLGYQPIFFPNGVITGTGYQFFGNFRPAVAATIANDSSQNGFADNNKAKFNPRGRGNLYIPPEMGWVEEFNTDCYFCIDGDELSQFVADNLLLKRVYEHFVAKVMDQTLNEQVELKSMIEIGSNTCLFPIEFSKRGVASCHGADIVDYSDVVSVLSVLNDTPIEFHHMRDDSDATWQSLPKVDLVWSYAVLLHQSNPLVHLTRLAAKARKAIFVMTNCGGEGDWGNPDDMAIKYCSANSYYASGFPNCFDVTIVSPALIRFSLLRLGFSRVLELPPPVFDDASETECKNFKGWMQAHRCFLAFRDVPLDDESLDDYSVETERSPYNGEEVRVYRGYHNNVFLKSSRYFIVPHDRWIASDYGRLRSFASLPRAITYLKQLAEEINPFPMPVDELDGYLLMRYRNLYYLCPSQMFIDPGREEELEDLHVLDSIDKWKSLRSQTSVAALFTQSYRVRDLVNNVCIVRTSDGNYRAFRIDADATPGESVADSASLPEIRRCVVTAELLASMTGDHCSDGGLPA